ncbi:hypothetical protein M1328_00065 [Patescibacteria group bacterium]|nr:hypothetical protein [Patescibacteria group bacterium]
MSQKTAVMTGMIVGSIIGSYLPTLWGAGIFSYWSLFTSTVGGFLGIYIGYKLSQ